MMLRLNLGCGSRKIDGFVHVDLADYPHIDYKCDIKNLTMFENDSVDLIYCSHALQYFDRLDAYVALTEWHRVLKVDGILRLAVPDFEAIVKVYLKYCDLEYRGILGPLYGKMRVGNKVIYHKTVYDFDSLRKLLELVGFRKVKRYDWRETVHKDYDDQSQAYIPHLDKEKGLLISLNIEAVK